MNVIRGNLSLMRRVINYLESLSFPAGMATPLHYQMAVASPPKGPPDPHTQILSNKLSHDFAACIEDEVRRYINNFQASLGSAEREVRAWH
jgi:hypothetical protein